MTDVKWTIRGREFVHCNCAWGCPCQFNSLPTHGHCQAVAAVEIEQGHHDDTDLSGLRIGMIVACDARYQSEVIAMLQTGGGAGASVIGAVVEGRQDVVYE